MLAAAYLALNQRGEGSSPSGPTCTRDVMAACLLAMQDVRVRFPLGALAQDVGKPGNPPVSGTGHRGFKSHRPDSRNQEAGVRNQEGSTFVSLLIPDS